MPAAAFNLPQEIVKIGPKLKSRDYLAVLLIALLVGGSVSGLGILYLNLGEQDWITSFYLGLGPTILFGALAICLVVALRAKASDRKYEELYKSISSYIRKAYGLVLKPNEVQLLLAGEKIDVNAGRGVTRKSVYFTGLQDGTKLRLFEVATDIELAAIGGTYTSDDLAIPANMDLPKKKLNGEGFAFKTAIAAFLVFFVSAGLLLVLLTLLLNFNLDVRDTTRVLDAPFNGRILFLSGILGVMIALAGMPIVLRNTEKVPVDSKVVVNQLIGFVKRRYNLVLTNEEALRLLTNPAPLNIDSVQGARRRIRLSTLVNGKDVRLLADTSGQDYPEF